VPKILIKGLFHIYYFLTESSPKVNESSLFGVRILPESARMKNETTKRITLGTFMLIFSFLRKAKALGLSNGFIWIRFYRRL